MTLSNDGLVKGFVVTKTAKRVWFPRSMKFAIAYFSRTEPIMKSPSKLCWFGKKYWEVKTLVYISKAGIEWTEAFETMVCEYESIAQVIMNRLLEQGDDHKKAAEQWAKNLSLVELY